MDLSADLTEVNERTADAGPHEVNDSERGRIGIRIYVEQRMRGFGAFRIDLTARRSRNSQSDFFNASRKALARSTMVVKQFRTSNAKAQI
jgi:hypothetical protein